MSIAISVNDIHKAFDTPVGRREVLKGVSFEISEGACCVIGGENGSGKSLMMSIISGLEKADKGSYTTSGRVGLVFQEAETQILGETPREDIAFGPKNLGLKKSDVELAVKLALNETGLTEKADFIARFLSGGEKRRLAVACMIAMQNPIIVLDEPYANLDYQGVKQVNSLIQNLKESGRTVVILSHEIEKCLALADQFIVLYQGQKVYDGEPEKAFDFNVEEWNIRNPFVSYKSVKDMVW